MHRATRRVLFSIATLSAVLMAAPAEGQGKGKGKGNKQKEQTRATAVYEDDRYSGSGRYDDRYGARGGNGNGKVPPGWCKGKGNPHNTPETCGYRSDRRSDDRYGRDTYGRTGRSGSYERDHSDFHYYLDRKYSDLSRDRPGDLRWQLEIRMRKKAEHDQWHRETGTRH